MGSVFVDHLEVLRNQVEANTPIPEELLEALTTLIKARLRGWRLLQSSPKLLYGLDHQEWSPASFMDLALDCYIYTFHKRRVSLLAQPAHKTDGLVALNVKHFLIDKGKRHNPISYRTRRNLKLTAEECVRSRELRTIQPEHLGSERGAVLALRTGHVEKHLDRQEVTQSLRREHEWANLIPSLPQDTQEVRTRLARMMVMLANQAPFLFWDLQHVALHDVTEVCMRPTLPSATVSFDSHQGNTPVAMIEAQLSDMTDSQWRKIDAGIKSAIESSGRREKVKRRWQKLWRALVESCVDADSLSQASLARSLGVSTSTLSEDMQGLQKIFRQHFPDIE